MNQHAKTYSLSACALAVAMMLSGCGGADGVDATPPTVTITDSESSATATGAVTFTFTFSEDVGTSFTVEDISVNGGAPGTLVKVDATHYTLVVTPASNTAGTISVSLAGGKFADLAQNANTLVTTATQAFDTTATLTVLASFDESTALTFTGFDGGEGSTLAVEPTGGSGFAAKVLRTGGQVWAGAKVNVGTINLTASNRTISAHVYSPTAGTPIVLKLEGANGDINSGDVQATETVVQGWQTLSWTIPLAKVGTAFNWVVMLPNLATKASDSPGEAYYFDDITLGTLPALPAATRLASFDETTALTFAGFDGAESSTIATAPEGGDGKAAKIVRAGGQVWAGAKVDVGLISLTASKRTIAARVYSPTAGTPIVLKLEGANGDINSGDVQATEAVVQGWQTLTWTIPLAKVGTAFNWVVMLPNLATKASDAPGETYYFDDIKLISGHSGAVVVACAPTAPNVLPNLVTFDGDCAALRGFEGTSSASVATDPAGGTNKVGKIVKPAGSAAAFYAGATVYTGADYSISTIPFVSAHPTVSMRVYSAYVGTRVHLKLENASNPGINVEHDAFTTKANEWETLTFDLSNTTTHFVPSGATTYNASAPTANYTAGAVYNKANVFFDYGLGSSASGAYAVMPAERTYYFDDLKFVP